MALADRDYMRNPPKQRGRTTRLDAAPTDGVIWEATPDRAPATEPPYRLRRGIILALWLAGATAVFATMWAIACAMVAAQWHGQGTTFTPPSTQGKPQSGGDNHGAG